MAAQIVLAACFAVLAVAHSVLGEGAILRPLFAAEWTTEPTPRWVVQAILRFAWHLTSLAWAAIAVMVFEVDVFTVAGVLALVSGAVIFGALRGHLAWPICLVGGFAGLMAADRLPDVVLVVGAAIAIVGLAAAGVLHVYWAAGGRVGFHRAGPEVDGGFNPPAVMTLAVAVALLGFAGLVAMTAFDDEPAVVRWLTIGGVAVLAARAVGDGKYVGFTKTRRESQFAFDDDRWFTPIVVVLALGSLAAVLV